MDKKYEIAVNIPMLQTFTYLSEEKLEPGIRVLVPFGPRKLIGVVLREAEEKPKSENKFKLRKISSVIDSTPIYNQTLLKLGYWMSEYYMHPIGEVFKTMLPASSTKQTKKVWFLTEEALTLIEQENTDLVETLKSLFKKRTSLTHTTLQKKIKALDLEPNNFLTKLKEQKLISLAANKTIKARQSTHIDKDKAEPFHDKEAPILTPPQQSIVDEIYTNGISLSPNKPVKPYLLHGVTGSGKTEVYLNIISKTHSLNNDLNQTVVLVPEISLTPQMTMVFEKRFPGQVAVVHSAMTDTDRWTQLDRIRNGEASILIGPRSAVFAAFKNLKLIIVDEEHDSSYKQTSGLHYNGRDIAILRGNLEKACVVLGSATPSLESYHNALTEKYTFLEMPDRVNKRPLPTTELVISQPSYRSGDNIKTAGEASKDDSLLNPIIKEALEKNIKDKNQSIVLVNRRGYAFYLFDVLEKKAYLCPNCSISMTLHARSTLLHCHYCDYQTTLKKVQKEHPHAKYVAVGYGSQKAEDSLISSLPNARIARLDSDIVTDRQVLPNILKKFREGEIDLLVGTQILAKGHDFPKVTLIAILEVDQLLNLPDFRAGERTFQLIVQAAGRAGRAELPGHVYIQCSKDSHPVIQAAISQDYYKFAAQELEFRKAHQYPPFSKLVLIEVNSENPRTLSQLCNRIEQWLDQVTEKEPELIADVKMLGPAIPTIETIRKRHRRTILCSSPKSQKLRAVVQYFVQCFHKLPKDIRIKIDVDPQSLL